MATVKEVKLMKNGAMVTPVVLADSIKNLDGTKFKDTPLSGQSYIYNYENYEARTDVNHVLPSVPFGKIGFVNIYQQNTDDELHVANIYIPSDGTYAYFLSVIDNKNEDDVLVGTATGTGDRSFYTRINANTSHTIGGIYVRIA